MDKTRRGHKPKQQQQPANPPRHAPPSTQTHTPNKKRGPAATPQDRLHQLLFVDEFSVEMVRVCSDTLAEVMAQGGAREHTLLEAEQLVTNLLSRAENQWISTLHTSAMFDLTMQVAKAHFGKPVTDNVLQGFIRRLSTSDTPLDLLVWLRERKHEYVSQSDLRPHFALLCQVLVMLVSKPLVRSETPNWPLHAAISIQVCATLQSFGAIIAAMSLSGAIAEQIASAPFPDSPGMFVLRHVVLPLVCPLPPVQGDVRLPATAEQMHGAELEAWMELASFAMQTCGQMSTSSKRAVPILARLGAPLSQIIAASCANGRAAVVSPYVANALSSAKLTQDASLCVQVLQAVDCNRHALGVNEAYHALASGLGESGTAVVCEQLVRWGTVLLTHSYRSLRESDQVERMVLADLAFLSTAKHGKLLLLQDGRVLARVCQACVWPEFSPVVASRVVELVHQLGAQRHASIHQLLLARQPACAPLGSPFDQNRTQRAWTPTFALDTSEYRVLRAKRFVDAMLDDTTREGPGLFAECLVESPLLVSAEAEAYRGEEQADLPAWLRFWGCRALSLCLLKSKFGSAKDTFERLEEMLKRGEGKANALLWTLHRELTVFAPNLPDAKVAAFFATKNADVCRTWLSRLVAVAVPWLSFPDLSFYYAYYGSPAMWTVRYLEQLALHGKATSLAVLGRQREVVAAVQSTHWLAATELYAQGALCLAKRALELVVREDEEEAGEVAASAARMLAECELRLAQWTTTPLSLDVPSSLSLLVLEPSNNLAATVATTSLPRFELAKAPLPSAPKSAPTAVCLRALEAGDVEFAKRLLPVVLVECTALDRIQLGNAHLASCVSAVDPQVLDLLCAPDSLERKLLEGNGRLVGPVLEETDVVAVHNHPVGGLARKRFANLAAERHEWFLAARFHHLSLAWDEDTLLLFLNDLGELGEGGDDEVEFGIPPARLLLPHLDQLLARATSPLLLLPPSSPRLQRFVRDCLLVLAEASPREMAWALVALVLGEEDENVPRIVRELVGAISPSSVWEETQLLAQALIVASRTVDEDFAHLLDELASKPPGLELSELGRDCHERHFAHPPPTSAYGARFRQSEAGLAVQAWCLDADSADKLVVARTLLHQHLVSNTRRSAREASPALAGQVTLFHGQHAFLRDSMQVLHTKTRPRKIQFDLAATGPKSFLLKSGEDLKLDQRLNALWALVCGLETYVVVPLSRRVGLIEWVENSLPLFQAYRNWRKHRGEENVVQEHAAALQHSQGNALDAFRAMKLARTGAEDGLKSLLWQVSGSTESWYRKTEAFTQSCGITSALGWLVGLGDRHLDNMLLRVDTGEVVHVDLNVCFDKGRRLKVPETVPFRLTGLVSNALLLGGLSAHGPFACHMQRTLGQIAQRRVEIAAFLEVFVYDSSDAGKRKGGMTLRLHQAEFESAKQGFVLQAETWLGETRAFAGVRVEQNGGGEEEESPRLLLDRARSVVHRAQVECEREKERASLALDRLVGCDRVLKTLQQEPCFAALERCVGQIRRFPTLAKLQLLCVQWAAKLGEALRQVTSSNVPAPGAMDWSMPHLTCPLQLVDALHVLVEYKAATLEQPSKKQLDCLALCDAVLVLSKLAEGEDAQARQAWTALQRACSRMHSPQVCALLSRAPQLPPKLPVDEAMASYGRLLTGSSGLLLQDVREALQRAVDEVRGMTYTRAAPESHQAKEANSRVLHRVQEASTDGELVARLIAQATSERNLSDMYVGWMPFI